MVSILIVHCILNTFFFFFFFMSYQWKPDETDNPNEIALKTCINNKENNPRQDDRWPTMRIRCPTAGAAVAIPSGRVG